MCNTYVKDEFQCANVNIGMRFRNNAMQCRRINYISLAYQCSLCSACKTCINATVIVDLVTHSRETLAGVLVLMVSKSWWRHGMKIKCQKCETIFNIFFVLSMKKCEMNNLVAHNKRYLNACGIDVMVLLNGPYFSLHHATIYWSLFVRQHVCIAQAGNKLTDSGK